MVLPTRVATASTSLAEADGKLVGWDQRVVTRKEGVTLPDAVWLHDGVLHRVKRTAAAEPDALAIV